MSSDLSSEKLTTSSSSPLRCSTASDLVVDLSLDRSSLNFFDSPAVQYLHDVYVLKYHSSIVDDKFIPVRSALNEHIYWHPQAMPGSLPFEDIQKEANARFLSLASTTASMRENDKCFDLRGLTYDCVFLMHPFEWYPYGHFFDTLQRLYPIDDGLKQVKSLLICDPRRVSDFYSHLEMLGYGAHQVITLPPHATSFRVSRLEVSSSPAPYSAFTEDSIKGTSKNWDLPAIERH